MNGGGLHHNTRWFSYVVLREFVRMSRRLVNVWLCCDDRASSALQAVGLD